MQGLMMDFELTVPVMLRRAEQLFGSREIVTRLPDRNLHRYTYGDEYAYNYPYVDCHSYPVYHIYADQHARGDRNAHHRIADAHFSRFPDQ